MKTYNFIEKEMRKAVHILMAEEVKKQNSLTLNIQNKLALYIFLRSVRSSHEPGGISTLVRWLGD